MKNFAKRSLAILLAVIMVVSVSGITAFAGAGVNKSQYKYYTVLGDGSGAGYGLDAYIANTGDEEAVLDGYVIPGSYAEIVGEAVGAETVDICAHTAWRTVELLRLLEVPGYENYDSYTDTAYYAFGKVDEFDLWWEGARVYDSILSADIISINFGSNDIFSRAIDRVSELHPNLVDEVVPKLSGFSGLIDMFRQMINNARKIGALRQFISDFKDCLSLCIDEYKVNITKTIEVVREINPDAKLLLLGTFCPISFDITIGDFTLLDLPTSLDRKIDDLNNWLKNECSVKDEYTFIDITKTNCFGLKSVNFRRFLNGDEDARRSAVKMVHPTDKGHAYIASQIINAMPYLIPIPWAYASVDPDTGNNLVEWGAVEGAEKYNVYVSDEYYEGYKPVYSTADLSYIDKNGTPGFDRYYRVSAVKNGVESDLSEVTSCLCVCTAPVVTATVKPSTGKIVLSWNAVKGADRYVIYRSTDPEGEFTKLVTTTSTKCANNSAKVGITYYYKIVAMCEDNDEANSPESAVVSATCTCPVPVLKATVKASTGKITLTWDPVAGAEKYLVYRSENKDTGFELLISTKGTKVNNTSAVAGKTYYYKVIAVSSANNGAGTSESAVVSCTCCCAAPKVSITRSDGHPKLTWKAVDGASKYVVYRATSKTGTYAKLATVKKYSLLNNTATAGKTYYYKVVAVNANSAANSAYSNIVSMKAK